YSIPKPPYYRSLHSFPPRRSSDLGDPTPVIGVVDDGSEEVRGGQDCEVLADPHRRGVIAVVEADEDVGARLSHQSADGVLELTRRNLAGAPSTVSEGRQTVMIVSHIVRLTPRVRARHRMTRGGLAEVAEHDRILQWRRPRPGGRPGLQNR